MLLVLKRLLRVVLSTPRFKLKSPPKTFYEVVTVV